ncbi:hypothetical protein FOA52_006272 [Chlamydomonas sp. UWO 241]|nr:hypothetical protein FOA52_006272 [Chlamydomonas sp. UWO 241]
MAIHRSAALTLLVLFVGPALVTARSLSLEQTILEGMQKDCLEDGEAGQGLTNAGCKACMESIGDRTDLMWPCGVQMCQNSSLFDAAYDAIAVDCAYCVANNDPVTCLLCNRDVPLNDYSALVAEHQDANGNVVPVFPADASIVGARLWCTNCSTYAIVPAGVPAGSVPPFADANSNSDTFRAACTVCANIPADLDNKWRDWCLACIWTTTAMPLPEGTLQYADWMQLQESNKTRDVDYGACAYHANHSYYVDKGWIRPEGIFETCTNTAVAPPGGGPVFSPPVVNQQANVFGSTSACLACMETTFQYVGLEMGGLTPDNSSKAYACANCRHPDWIKVAEDATMCFACVVNANV